MLICCWSFTSCHMIWEEKKDKDKAKGICHSWISCYMSLIQLGSLRSMSLQFHNGYREHPTIPQSSSSWSFFFISGHLGSLDPQGFRGCDPWRFFFLRRRTKKKTKKRLDSAALPGRTLTKKGARWCQYVEVTWGDNLPKQMFFRKSDPPQINVTASVGPEGNPLPLRLAGLAFVLRNSLDTHQIPRHIPIHMYIYIYIDIYCIYMYILYIYIYI